MSPSRIDELLDLLKRKDTQGICKKLSEAKKEREVIYNTDDIKQLLCTLMVAEVDEQSLQEIIIECHDYVMDSHMNAASIFEDNSIIDAACKNNRHAGICRLFELFGHHIYLHNIFDPEPLGLSTTSWRIESHNNYLLTLAKDENNADLIAELFKHLKNPTFKPEVIKKVLIEINEWRDDVRREQILKIFKTNTQAFGLISWKDVFADGELLGSLCRRNLLPRINYFITNYHHAIKCNTVLGDYLLKRIAAKDFASATALLVHDANTSESTSVFPFAVLGSVLHTAISQSHDGLFDLICGYIKSAKSIKEIFSVRNDDQLNPLIAACKANFNYPIRLVELIGDIRKLRKEASDINDAVHYDVALQIALSNSETGISANFLANLLAKKLIELGALTTLPKSGIEAQVARLTNLELKELINKANAEEVIFSVLDSIFTVKNSAEQAEAFSQIENALKSGISSDCRQFFNGNTPLMFLGFLDTKALRGSCQINLFIDLVYLFVQYKADVKLLTVHSEHEDDCIRYNLRKESRLFLSALGMATQKYKVDTTRIANEISTLVFLPPLGRIPTKTVEFEHDLPLPALTDEMKAILAKFYPPGAPVPSFLGLPPAGAVPQPSRSAAPSLASNQATTALTSGTIDISSMIKGYYDRGDRHFKWDMITTRRLTAIDLNVSAPVGKKSVLFFDMADNAGLLDVFIRSARAKGSIPTFDQMQALFNQGLNRTFFFSKSNDSATELFYNLASNPDDYELVTVLPLLLDLKIPCTHHNKFRVIADWLVNKASASSITVNAADYLKPFKLEIWNAMKQMYTAREITLDKLELLNQRLEPYNLQKSAARSVFYAGHADPTKKRLGTILEELNALTSVGKLLQNKK